MKQDNGTAKQNNVNDNVVVHVFGEFRLIPEQWTLRHGEDIVQLEPKTFDLLVLLVERRGQVVSKQEILAKVWAGLFVEDVALARNISVLRSLFNDTPPYRYVTTVRNQGYSFVADVKIESIDTIARPVHSTTTTKQKHSRIAMAAAAMLFAVLCGWLLNLLVHHAFQHEYLIKQLTNNSSELPIVFAALSHDGRKVALIEGKHLYLDSRTLNQRFEVELPAGLVPKTVEWFPDDLHLLVSLTNERNHSTSLLKVSPLAASIAPISVGDIAWTAISPDGKKIAFTRPRDCEVWLTNSDGSEPQKLLSLPDACPIYGLQFLKHANELIFVRGNHTMTGTIFYFYNIATRQLKETELNYAVSALAATKDNRAWISFWSGTALSGSTLATVEINFSEATISKVKKIASWNDIYISRISPASLDGTVFLNARKYQSDVLIADWDDDNHVASNFRRLTLNDASDRPSAWYGNELLFYSNRLGPYGIYRQAIDSVDVTAVVNDQQQNIRPQISSDGKWMYYLAVQGERTDAPASLMRLSLQNGSKTMIRPASSLTDEFRCATRANICIFSRSAGDQLIFYRLGPEDEQAELARIPWHPVRTIYTWDISPDGRNIVYIDTAHQSHRIQVISVFKDHITTTFPMPSTTDTLLSVSWDASGTGVFVSGMNTESALLSQFHLMPDGTISMLRNPAWDDEGWIIASPDNKHLALQTYTSGGNIWEMTMR